MNVKVASLALFLASACAHAEFSSLCQASEITVWSCQAIDKTYSVCASHDLADSAGYLQYRAGSATQATFKYPITLLQPKGHFEFDVLPHGVALSFANEQYGYIIAEDIKGGASISVDKQGTSISTVHCSDSTNTLSENSTINLFKAAGITK
jgi:hypothetical protein